MLHQSFDCRTWVLQVDKLEGFLLRLHISLWVSHLVPQKERIKFLANPVQTKLTGQLFNLLHCLNF